MNTHTLRLTDNGNPPRMTVARIDHEFVNGTHIFTSSAIKGLFLASKSASEIKAQLVPAIVNLIKLNFDMDVKVHLGGDFEDFLEEHQSIIAPDADDETIAETFAVIQAA